MEDVNEGCCPVFNPVPWDEKTHAWFNKKFIKTDLPQFLNIPLPGTISGMINKQMKLIRAADALPHTDEYLWLYYNSSPWKSTHYIHVLTEVPGAENIELSGTFFTKVFDGPYNFVSRWKREMEQHLKFNGYKADRYYVYYTTCPKCAQKYGHNYIVLFASV